MTASGMIFEAIVGTFFILLSNIFLRLISLKIMEKVKKNLLELCIIRIECKKESEISIRNNLYKYLSMKNLNLDSLEKNEITKELVKLKATLLTIRPNNVESVVNLLGKDVNINSIKWSHINYKDMVLEDEESD